MEGVGLIQHYIMRWHYANELIMLQSFTLHKIQRHKAGEGKSFEQRIHDGGKYWPCNESMMSNIVLILDIR